MTYLPEVSCEMPSSQFVPTEVLDLDMDGVVDPDYLAGLPNFEEDCERVRKALHELRVAAAMHDMLELAFAPLVEATQDLVRSLEGGHRAVGRTLGRRFAVHEGMLPYTVPDRAEEAEEGGEEGRMEVEEAPTDQASPLGGPAWRCRTEGSTRGEEEPSGGGSSPSCSESPGLPGLGGGSAGL